jgi:isoquinoline 1-oxidoreductase beta subunit
MSTRRRFLLTSLAAGGALALGWGLAPPRQRLTTAQPLAVPAGGAQHAVNGWLLLGSDDTVTVMLARSEMGQGVATTLAMLLADELDADWSRVRTAPAPIDKIYNNLATVVDGLPFHPEDEGAVKRGAGWLTAKVMREFGVMVTGGSSSIKDLWLPMREAGAAARAMLVGAAAQAWGVPLAEVTAAAGVLAHAPSNRTARFGDFAERAARQPVPGRVVLKTADRFTLIGHTLPRRDAAAKQDGSARFGIDALPPGLRHASVVMCPTLGGRLRRFEPAPAQAMPGVRQVLAVPGSRGGTDGIAVIADNPWQAMQAAQALGDAASTEWDHGPAATLDSASITAQLGAALDDGPGFSYRRVGDAEAALKTAARTLSAEYHAPLLAHATLEPQNCTVLLAADKTSATVWAPTQVPDLARIAAAKALGLDKERVTVHVTLLGGGFGRRLEADFIAQAATIAAALPGTPVQTLWRREQDFTHDLYRPPCVARYRVGLDAQGALVAWSAQSAGPSIVQQFIARQLGLPGGGPDKTTAEGAFDQPYEFPAATVGHRIVALPVPVGFWRSVGHSHQAFFKESFLDEVAHAAGRDPLAFRLALLAQHPKHAAVLQAAAKAAGWGTPSPPAPDGAKTARGLALHQSFGSTVAQVVEASLDPAVPGRIRVHRVVVAIDCGTPVNPGLIAQQMEGAVVFGLSAALHGEITLAKGQVQQTNFHQQPLLRLADCPRIDVQVLPSTAPPEGVGEPGVPPVAPALANALFALTGQRLRRLPLVLPATPATAAPAKTA